MLKRSLIFLILFFFLLEKQKKEKKWKNLDFFSTKVKNSNNLATNFNIFKKEKKYFYQKLFTEAIFHASSFLSLQKLSLNWIFKHFLLNFYFIHQERKSSHFYIRLFGNYITYFQLPLSRSKNPNEDFNLIQLFG